MKPRVRDMILPLKIFFIELFKDSILACKCVLIVFFIAFVHPWNEPRSLKIHYKLVGGGEGAVPGS